MRGRNTAWDERRVEIGYGKNTSMHRDWLKTGSRNRFLVIKTLLQADNVLNKNISKRHRDLVICVGEKCAKLPNGESPERP